MINEKLPEKKADEDCKKCKGLGFHYNKDYQAITCECRYKDK